jgi:hypothetical protein
MWDPAFQVGDDLISWWSWVLAAQNNIGGGSATLRLLAAILADDIRGNFGDPSALLVCAWCTSTQASEATHPDHSPPSLLWRELEKVLASLDRVRLVVDKGTGPSVKGDGESGIAVRDDWRGRISPLRGGRLLGFPLLLSLFAGFAPGSGTVTRVAVHRHIVHCLSASSLGRGAGGRQGAGGDEELSFQAAVIFPQFSEDQFQVPLAFNVGDLDIFISQAIAHLFSYSNRQDFKELHQKRVGIHVIGEAGNRDTFRCLQMDKV